MILINPKSLLIFLIFSSMLCKGQTYVLGTASLISHQYESRRHEYINCIHRLSQFGVPVFVVENCAVGPTFLDELPAQIFYSQTNNFGLKNKGINEAIALRQALDYFKFDDDDLIVKITSRYHLNSDYLFQIINRNMNADAFVRVNYSFWYLSTGDVFTACFAMKCKLFKEMLDSFNYNHMERYMINFETEVANYIKGLEQKGKNIIYLDKIDLTANCTGLNNQILHL